MDKLYEDFTTQLLPKISDGLMISKEYFTDLFGRYINYLVITDSLLVVFSLVLLIVGSYMIYRGIKISKSIDGYDNFPETVLIIFGIMVGFFGILLLFHSTGNLIKDIYIPEVRVYESLPIKINNN